MTGLLLLAALLAALAASGYRTLRRHRRRRALAALAGGSRVTALAVDDFRDIDQHLATRECPCGGLLASHGERSERHEVRGDAASRGAAAMGRSSTTSILLRVVRVECRRCEERSEVWFDVTRAYH